MKWRAAARCGIFAAVAIAVIGVDYVTLESGQIEEARQFFEKLARRDFLRQDLQPSVH
jgi:hypothetical protein